MMTFCKKSAHHFLGSSNTNDNGTVDLPSFLQHHHQNTTSGGQKPPDVIEETPHFSNLLGTSANLATGTKRDPGGIGFIDDVGGSVDGLMSCTESLGFESSDERRVDNQIENLDVVEEMCWRREPMAGSRWRREHVKREAKQFPPPLSSFNQDGKPTFFLRPLRKDGKLELQEVKIGRPEILRASRQDGRLRLHLIKNEDEDFEEEYEQEEEEEEEVDVEERAVQEEENMQEIQENVQEMEEGQIGEEEEEVEEKVEERAEGWQIPASPGGGGDGFLRCHEQVSHHQNHRRRHHGHHLDVWRQHCVTIR